MPRRLLLSTALLAVAAAGGFGPAQAGPPASFTKTVTFVDSTPDPSAFFLGPEHCMGRLPAEQPVEVTIPAPGVVKVAISGFTGEWSLMITDKNGRVITTADADAPATESTTFRMRRAGTINILPCNIAGTFEAQLTYGYTYKK
jgi:hypothetical protein